MNPSLLILVATLAGLVIGAFIVYWIVGRRLDQAVLTKTHEFEAAQQQLQHSHDLREAALQLGYLSNAQFDAWVRPENMLEAGQHE